MKINRTALVIIILLFAIGIMIGSSLGKSSIDDSTGDFEEEIVSPGNDYNEAMVVNSTGNLFVKIAKGLEKIINKGINLIVDAIAKVFGLIFGL